MKFTLADKDRKMPKSKKSISYICEFCFSSGYNSGLRPYNLTPYSRLPYTTSHYLRPTRFQVSVCPEGQFEYCHFFMFSLTFRLRILLIWLCNRAYFIIRMYSRICWNEKPKYMQRAAIFRCFVIFFDSVNRTNDILPFTDICIWNHNNTDFSIYF